MSNDRQAQVDAFVITMEGAFRPESKKRSIGGRYCRCAARPLYSIEDTRTPACPIPLLENSVELIRTSDGCFRARRNDRTRCGRWAPIPYPAAIRFWEGGVISEPSLLHLATVVK